MDEKLLSVNGEPVLSQNELKDGDIVGVVVFSTYF
jgi:sulfur carrier protein ThiS